MSDLEQAVNERIEEFRVGILEAKRLEGMTNADLAELCEVGECVFRKFLSNRATPRSSTLVKISLALGIQI
jgi:ribosome-binding protein aMBF1 (putative translation factor)